MVQHFRQLRVYIQAFQSAMTIYMMSKHFPREEQYSLTDQIRRASRSVNTNIAEAWRKRRYPASFVSKLTDADAEAGECQVWLEFAWQCGYITEEKFRELDKVYDNICGGLVLMIDNAQGWCGPSTAREEEPEYHTEP